jgi:adenosylhomocysteine nucleosidase
VGFFYGSITVTELAFNDPCILFALGRESAAFRREFRPQQRFPGAPCRAQFCGPSWLTVLLVETGVGQAATERALVWILDKPKMGGVPYRPNLVLSAGFAGALDPSLAIGDVVLATEIVDTKGNLWQTTWPVEPLKGEWRPPMRRGRVLTSPELVDTPEKKNDLGLRQQAVAVDMESAVLARLCSRNEVPFGCVRSISDRADTTLPSRLTELLNNGRASWPRLLAACLRSPGLVGELRRLARDTKRAGAQLGKALGELLTLTLPWNEESEGAKGSSPR